jgi:hypothetical protein
MSDSPLFPWQASEDSPKQTQEIKDPLSPVRTELPKIDGLMLNEVLFAQWAEKQYSFIKEGLESNKPKQIPELIDFCHKFLCLRLELADWVKDDLAFEGQALTPADSLSIALPNGGKKAAPLYVMWMIYGFFVEEQAAWLGKSSSMMEAIKSVVAPSTGGTSIGDSSGTTQTTQDSPGEHSDDAQSTSSSKRLKAPKKPTSNDSKMKAA